ncbi:HTH-type transcriptional regulator DegA [Spirochaetia bacterium]|nr:HTH-type transcriptional regulator DegA [Spirochaetia bacterium]
MPTLYHVAEKAGVSKTLVSRVLNNQSGVSPASRRKILDAMDAIHYVPNALARSLVLQKTNMLGVVLDSLCETYYFDLIRGVEAAVDQAGYEVLFSSGREGLNRKEKTISFFSQGRVDGVIIYGSNLRDIEMIERLSKRTFPFVIVENEANIPNINTVVLDNVLGGEMAVNHLVSLGCRNIWHFTGDMKRTISQSRKNGYLKGMQKNGLSVKPNMIIESHFDMEYGYTQMKQLLRGLPPSPPGENRGLPDGIFFSADVTAVGAMEALMEAGIDIPGQIKIVGFDNDTYCMARHAAPGLTTLSQPLAEMGAAAVFLLLSSIKNPEEKKQTKVFIPKLLVRESSVKTAVRPPVETG